MYKKCKAEIIGVLICLTLGMLSGYISKPMDYAWYSTLQKPDFNPPSWIFAPVWTMLYILIGIASGKLWRLEKSNALNIFIIHFIFNILWSPLFFHFHRIDLALYDICLMEISLVILLYTIRDNLKIFILLIPYALWSSFALILNFSIYYLNL